MISYKLPHIFIIILINNSFYFVTFVADYKTNQIINYKTLKKWLITKI